MSNNGVTVYSSSDYAGGSAKDWGFYYGYEAIYCPNHSFADVQESVDCTHDNNGENDCDNVILWCFVAKYQGKIVAWYTTEDLEASGINLDDTAQCVLAGILLMLKEGKLKYA
jgi:hypothetical protein